ncbi:MAG: hypothetical protein OHK006_12380 [Thermodesulfovibrionales bacterium]
MKDNLRTHTANTLPNPAILDQVGFMNRNSVRDLLKPEHTGGSALDEMNIRAAAHKTLRKMRT